MIEIVFKFKYIHTYARVTYYFFFNNLNNYIYFYNKKLCLILNASMHLHVLHASKNRGCQQHNFLPLSAL